MTSYFTSNGVSPYFNIDPVHVKTAVECLGCLKGGYDVYTTFTSPRIIAPMYVVGELGLTIQSCVDCWNGLPSLPPAPPVYGPFPLYEGVTPLVPFPSPDLYEGYPYPVEDDFIRYGEADDEYEYDADSYE